MSIRRAAFPRRQARPLPSLSVLQFLCFDACPVHACLSHVPPRMAELTPDAKLIFMMRDPLAAVLSGELMVSGLSDVWQGCWAPGGLPALAVPAGRAAGWSLGGGGAGVRPLSRLEPGAGRRLCCREPAIPCRACAAAGSGHAVEVDDHGRELHER